MQKIRSYTIVVLLALVAAALAASSPSVAGTRCTITGTPRSDRLTGE